MDKRTPKPKRTRDGSGVQEQDRLSASTSLPTMTHRLSESHIGVNYMLQIEDLLPEEVISSEEAEVSGCAAPFALPSASSSQQGPAAPLFFTRDSSQTAVPRHRPRGRGGNGASERARGHVSREIGLTLASAATPTESSFSPTTSPKVLVGGGYGGGSGFANPSSASALAQRPMNTPFDSRDFALSSHSAIGSTDVMDTALPLVPSPPLNPVPSSLMATPRLTGAAALPLTPPPLTVDAPGFSPRAAEVGTPVLVPNFASHSTQTPGEDAASGDGDTAGARESQLSYSSATNLAMRQPLETADVTSSSLFSSSVSSLWPAEEVLNQLPTAPAVDSEPVDLPEEEASHVPTPLLVPTITVSAIAMILGVLFVAVIGFIPVYVTGFREVDAAFSAVQTQATSSIITASSTPMHKLPQFTSAILSDFATLEVDGVATLPTTAELTLFRLGNLFSSGYFHDFLAVMQFVDVTPGREWRVLVNNHGSDKTLLALTQSTTDSPSTTVFYELDPITLHRNFSRRQRSLNLTMHDAIFDDRLAFKHVVMPWNTTYDHNRQPPLQTYWTTFNSSGSFAYFDFVVPVRLAGGGVAYLESLMRRSSVMRLVNTHLIQALRQNGRYFVLDPRTGLVVANSWNQSQHRDPHGEITNTILYADDIADPLARAAVQLLKQMGYLGPKEVTQRTEGLRARARFRFGKDTAWIHVHNYAAWRAIGLNVVFVVVTLESDYFTAVYKTRTFMVCSMVVIAAAVAAGSYLCATYVVRSLKKLIVDLQSSKNLQFATDTAPESGPALSLFTELMHVQLAYAQLQRQLMALKTLLPGPLLVPAAEFGGGGSGAEEASAAGSVGGSLNLSTATAKPGRGDASFNTNAAQGAEGATSAVGNSASLLTAKSAVSLNNARGMKSSTGPLDSSGRLTPLTAKKNNDSITGNANSNASASQSEAASTLLPVNSQGSLRENLRISRKWRQDMRLNTKIFNEQVNVFQRKYCSMLFMCRYYTQEVDYGSLNRYFSACYTAAAEYNGCVEFLRPDYAVCTFGAHTQMPMHTTRATQCALAIYNAIPPEERDKINYVLDSNEYLVGTCGAQHGKKGRVVFDVMHMMSIVRMCRMLGHHGIIVTQSTATRLPDYQSVPIDCILGEFFSSPIVICEVREPTKGANIALMAKTAKRFREAFHYMTKGRYDQALRIYRKIGPQDATAVRLASTCRQNLRQNNHQSFVTMRPLPRMNFLSRILANKNLAPFLRIHQQYIGQVLGDSMLFRPGHAPPLQMEQGIVQPIQFDASAKDGSRHHSEFPSSPVAASASVGAAKTSTTTTTRNSGSASKGLDSAAASLTEKHASFFRTRASQHEGSQLRKGVGGGHHRSHYKHANYASAASNTSSIAGTATTPTAATPTTVADEVASGAVPRSQNRREGRGSTDVESSAKTPAVQGRSSRDASEDESRALFEWIEVASGSSSVAAPNNASSSSVSTAGDHKESLVFVDDNERHWSRSLKAIGDGAFSVVYLGMSEDGVQVAIKCIPRRRRDISEDNVRGEVRMMAELRHPNIVQYIGLCATKTHLSIIMEYVPGGSLFAFTHNFGRLDLTIARRFLVDILSGLAYLHARNIVHCDVKPHNMLIGMDGVCKLSDFGSTVSEATDFAKLDTEVVLRGTALYMAPEVARGERCTPQSDIYSLGVSLLEMLLGRPPWKWASTASPALTQSPIETFYRNDAQFVQLLSRGEVTPQIPDNLDRRVYNLCQACCQPDPSKRPTAKELMSFPFLL